MLLSILVFGPITGAILVYFAGYVDDRASKALTIIISAATVGLSLYVLFGLNWSVQGFQLQESYDWARDFGLTYIVGIDGISVPFLVISSFLTTLSAAGSWGQITARVKEYNALLLLFEGAMIGVFTSLNLIAFYVFWEIVLVVMFFFIGVWGGPHRKYAAMKFLIMTHVGGVLMLLSFIALYTFSNPHTFNFIDLVNLPLLLPIQILISLGLFIGFGVKLPIVPLHTWLPPAYAEAPSPVSVLLAGVLGSMGGYGFIRMNLFLMPEASRFLAPVFMGFGLLTMFYGAIVAMVQQDFKRLVAFTSINHMGYVLLGTFALTTTGISNAVFQMFNHACVIGCLFLMSGVIHARMGTRTIKELRGLGGAMPKLSFLLVLASLGAMGFPGFSNFISEYYILLAGISVYFIYAIALAVPAITAGYLVWMLRRVLLSPAAKPMPSREASWYTLLTLAVFLVPLLILGFYPAPLLQQVIIPAVQNLFH
ncbi:MAG TPA: NADH-quinone oxidoreductase subunit M [Candidatus Acidoferrales bacterium]|nr:NADH-quinone oxidoreductase subunit M [Candidatus Acidoferrales bacterium]